MRTFLALIAVALVAAACSASPGGAPPTCGVKEAWGDSVSADNMGATPPILGWPSQPPLAGTVANLSAGGATAAALAQAIEQDTAACPGVRLIYFEGGINDLYAGSSPTQVEATYADLLSRVGVPIKFLALTPLVNGGKLVALQPARLAVNAWLRANLSSVTIDCTNVLADANGWLRPEYAADNAIHLSIAGQQALAGCVHNS
jgi:hypothetical protein